MASSVCLSAGESGFSTRKVRMFSSICAMSDMPLRIIVTPGTSCRKRKAQAAGLSSGRRARSVASFSSGSFASLPPRTGSITHTGMCRSFSRATFAAASCSVQSR